MSSHGWFIVGCVSDRFLYQSAALEREERDTINRLSMAPQIAGVPFQPDD